MQISGDDCALHSVMALLSPWKLPLLTKRGLFIAGQRALTPMPFGRDSKTYRSLNRKIQTEILPWAAYFEVCSRCATILRRRKKPYAEKCFGIRCRGCIHS